MEIREAIPEYTPVPEQEIPQGKDDLTTMKNNISSRLRTSNYTGMTLEVTDAGTFQRDVNENAQETRSSPKRLKNACRTDRRKAART